MQTEVSFLSQYGVAVGAILTLIFMFLVFILKVLPTWERIKVREFEIRTEEAKVTGQISTALLQSAHAQEQLASSLGTLGATLNHIAVEQRKVTDNLLILQRVNANETNAVTETVDSLVEEIGDLKDTLRETGNHGHNRPKAVTTTRK